MRVAITISAQKALLNGSAKHGFAAIELSDEQVLSLTETQRKELAQRVSNYTSDIQRGEFVITENAYAFSFASFDELKTALDTLSAERLAERLAEAERKEKAAKAHLGSIVARLSAWIEGKDENYYGFRMKYLDDPNAIRSSHPQLYAQVIAMRDEREQEFAQKERDREAREEAIRKQREQADREREEKQVALNVAKDEFRSEWLNEHGTDSQREREKAGLLADQEIEDAIEAAAFASLKDIFLGDHSYQKMCRTEVCSCDSCDCGSPEQPRVTFKTTTDACATAETWELIKRVRGAMPDAALTLRDHTGTCGDCDCELTKQGLLIRIAVGPFSFSREIAV